MNKKGFTLIELMGVIIIIGLLIILAIPSITNLLNDEEENISSAMEKVLLQAGELYTQDNSGIYPKTEGNVYCVTLKELVDEEYLGSPIKDPISSNEIDQNKYIKTSIQNGTYNYEITDTCESVNIAYKCIRATQLHTEECTQTDSTYYCSGAGYTTDGLKGTTTITYGNLGTKGILTSGDAFDCDLNGDGIYDATNERFYYVSDLYNTTSKEFDNNYAVLIYYNNTIEGLSNTSGAAYETDYHNWYGPTNAITNLPTTKQWSNISLSNTSRAIITHTGATSTTNGGTLPELFSYTKTVDGETVPLAARLLTYQEISSACGSDGNPTSTGELDTCNYLFENTKYSSSSMPTYGPWLETSEESNSCYVWCVDSRVRHLCLDFTASSYGVRPVIEVLKTDIDY